MTIIHQCKKSHLTDVESCCYSSDALVGKEDSWLRSSLVHESLPTQLLNTFYKCIFHIHQQVACQKTVFHLRNFPTLK